MIVEFTDDNFEQLVQGFNKAIVIDFMAAWCAPCKTVGENLKILAEEYKGIALIGKVDVDLNPILSSTFGVRNMPTVLYLKEGKVIDKQVGSTSKLVLEEKLKAIL